MRRTQARSSKSSTSRFHFRPFRELDRLKPAPAPAPAAPPPQAPPRTTENEADLFEREMSGVRPLPADRPSRIPQSPAKQPRTVTTSEAEALAALSDLVNGSARFDVTDTPEYLEGCVVGTDPRLVRRLRAGEFAYQSHLDLHRMTTDSAKVAVSRFLDQAHRDGQRCVLIIHGRGRNSQGQVPVLKNWLADWLARGPWARLVLAFTSARACDGGVGALYVLLRRNPRRKRPIRVTHGAKI